MKLLQEKLPANVTLAVTVLAGFAGLLIAWGAQSPWAWAGMAKALTSIGWLSSLLGLIGVLFGFLVVLAVALIAGAATHTILSQRIALIGALLIAGTIFAVMAQAIAATDTWGDEPMGGAEDFTTLADGIFDTHVLAFEVLGVLLTAAMIGAMVIARPLGVAEDSANYATRLDAKEVEELQKLSDVDANMGGES